MICSSSSSSNTAVGIAAEFYEHDRVVFLEKCVFSAVFVSLCVSLCAVRLLLRACAIHMMTVKSVSGSEGTPVFCGAIRSVSCLLLLLH